MATKRMASFLAQLSAVALLAVASTGAYADPLNPLNIAPDASGGFSSTGSFSQNACLNSTTCPQNGASINGSVDIFFNIVQVNGIANINVVGNTTPNSYGTFSFAYTVYNPANAVISTGTPQNPADFSVPIGNGYKITMNWTLLSSNQGEMDSANWSLILTTGPAHNVPEPGTLLLLGVALAGLGFARRKKI